jgi:hypothetical protein
MTVRAQMPAGNDRLDAISNLEMTDPSAISNRAATVQTAILVIAHSVVSRPVVILAAHPTAVATDHNAALSLEMTAPAVTVHNVPSHLAVTPEAHLIVVATVHSVVSPRAPTVIAAPHAATIHAADSRRVSTVATILAARPVRIRAVAVIPGAAAHLGASHPAQSALSAPRRNPPRASRAVSGVVKITVSVA